MNITEKDKARFFAKVGPPQLNGCCLWMDAKDRKGYGSFYADGKQRKAHRAAWTIVNGPIPAGLCVCHKCDNPSCCLVDHLWLGTIADNHADMLTKGRQSRGAQHGASTSPERRPRGVTHGLRLHPERVARGVANGQAKLTESQVKTIRTRYATGGTTLLQLARAYGISEPSIWRITTRDTWKHI
jgi:HNH endonuclease